MARNLTDIPYIGEQTENDLRRRLRGSRATSMIGNEVSVNEAERYQEVTRSILNARQQRELAEVATGFLPERSARQQQESTMPSPEERDTIRRGDFRVGRDVFQNAQETHDERTARSQELDEERRARVTTDFDRWAADPNSWDFPGVDTPSQRRPRRQEKDRGFVDENSLLRPFDDGGDDEDEDDSIIPGF